MDPRYAILIVDDQADIRAAVRRAIRAPGWEIWEAPAAAPALEILRSQAIQAIVSDYEMPGMTGLDFLQQVRLRWPNIYRVLLTAQTDLQIAVRALNEGAVHRFLLKPWDQFDLRGILRMGLHAMDGR